MLKDITPSNKYIPPQTNEYYYKIIDIHSSHIFTAYKRAVDSTHSLKTRSMVWVIPVLLLLASGGWAVPLVDSQRNNGEPELHETVEEMQAKSRFNFFTADFRNWKSSSVMVCLAGVLFYSGREKSAYIHI